MNTEWLLHYPVWELGRFGGGFWIALMATVHVYVAHFAVGAGLFLVVTEIKGCRENSPAVLDYVHRHSKFFLLVSAVFGSVTGVGIWFVISVLSPGATAILVNAFTFAWAAEWAFFLGEIVALFVYFYTFGRMNQRDHLTVGWIYFAFAWLSLFTVNGIISFMLTPGDWPVTRNFWDGIFNPSFWPSLAFRTSMSFMLAGLFGFVTSVGIKDADTRDSMLKYCAKWLILPLVFILITGWWYVAALPNPQKTMVLNLSPETLWYLKAFLWLSPVIFILGLGMALRVPLTGKKILTGVLVMVGLAYMGAFEWARESGRRPYLIYGHMYSNGILVQDAEKVQQAGLLKSARWARYQEITRANQLEAGKDIFNFLCSSCHSIGGPMNDILPLTQPFTVFGMDAMLDGMGKIITYMPPFMGNQTERKALAVYILKGLHKKNDAEPAADVAPIPVDIPAFDPDKDGYVLLAWSGKGMHCVSDNERYFSFSTPGNDIFAQLIKRGPLPERMSEGITLTYRLEDGFRNPAAHSDFWKFAKALTGKDLPENTGITGKGLSGEMDYDEPFGGFAARGIPVLPYRDDGMFIPYPLVMIEARDNGGNILAATKITAPVSTEMSCSLCHGGEWRVDGKAGLSDDTAKNILSVHDRMSRTELAKASASGNPVMCQSCHGQDAGRLNLSAAIHGFHANYLTQRGAVACASCHPGWPGGITRAFRGIHRSLEMDCTHCHGSMEDHALSLLTAEKNAGKQQADGLMKHLNPRMIGSVREITPRQPWVNLPDCLNCHVDFSQPQAVDTFNQWTVSESDLYRMRSSEGGLKCAGCHGSPHAIYPAANTFGNDRDNIPPMQHQGNPYPISANKNCKVCHTVEMEDEFHHPNSLTLFRNTR
jgi:mono/diheme cytochrome c family protein